MIRTGLFVLRLAQCLASPLPGEAVRDEAEESVHNLIGDD